MRTHIPDEPTLFYKGQVIPTSRALHLARLVEENHEDFVAGGCVMAKQWPNGFDQFNWLKTPLGDELVPAIGSTLEQLGFSRDFKVACWANVYRPGEWIDCHHHSNEDDPNNFLSGTLCLSTVEGFRGVALGLDGPGFPWTWVTDQPGQMLIFNSRLIHATQANPGPQNRISINFDVYPEGTEAYAELPIDNVRYLHYAAFTSSYSLPEFELLDSERPPCRPPVYQ